MTSDSECMKNSRLGAFWKTDAGTVLIWNDDDRVFQDNDTGEIYEVVDRLSEDVVLVR